MPATAPRRAPRALPHANHALIDSITAALVRRANPAKAEPMRAYMKSEMPYYGVQMAGQTEVSREVFPQHPLGSPDEWRDTILALWRGATHREARYAAISLAEHRPYRRFQTLDALPLYEELIVTGAWWDYVDAVAGHLVGGLLRTYPVQMKPVMRSWSRHANMWKRRTSIICQLSFKQDTDLQLLYDCIEPNLTDPEFFIRKAIGWALRQYAWTDPDEVRRYVREHAGQLSPLSRREALKNVGA
jgi:3-methyladenine DNA glycosylase AlkD